MRYGRFASGSAGVASGVSMVSLMVSLGRPSEAAQPRLAAGGQAGHDLVERATSRGGLACEHGELGRAPRVGAQQIAIPEPAGLYGSLCHLAVAAHRLADLENGLRPARLRLGEPAERALMIRARPRGKEGHALRRAGAEADDLAS